jgi:L-threonylcarbamoyladenylate synthase
MVWHSERDPLPATDVSPSRRHLLARSRLRVSDEFGHVAVMPSEPKAFAKALYAELHRCDELGAQLIVVEAVPPLPEWEGIADRLRRAAA